MDMKWAKSSMEQFVCVSFEWSFFAIEILIINSSNLFEEKTWIYCADMPSIVFLLPPQVTLLHVESEQELMSAHSFRVDASVKNVTLHITGILTECMLTSPSGNCSVLLTLGTYKTWAADVFVFYNEISPVVHLPLLVRPKPVSVEWARPSGRVGALQGSVPHQPALSYTARPVDTPSQEWRTPHIPCNR